MDKTQESHDRTLLCARGVRPLAITAIDGRHRSHWPGLNQVSGRANDLSVEPKVAFNHDRDVKVSLNVLATTGRFDRVDLIESLHHRIHIVHEETRFSIDNVP